MEAFRPSVSEGECDAALSEDDALMDEEPTPKKEVQQFLRIFLGHFLEQTPEIQKTKFCIAFSLFSIFQKLFIHLNIFIYEYAHIYAWHQTGGFKLGRFGAQNQQTACNGGLLLHGITPIVHNTHRPQANHNGGGRSKEWSQT